MAKTIFITSFHPHISRNIFLTGFFRLLKSERDALAVIVCPDYKAEYFKNNFEAENVKVEGVPVYRASKKKLGLVFKKTAFCMLPTETRRIKQLHKFYRDKKISHFVFFVLANFCGRLFWARRFFRYVDLKLSPSGLFNELLRKYRPDAVFSTDLHDENDVSLMQDARRLKIPVLGMFRSWDNPTQSILRVFPDRLLAGSEAIREETTEIQGYPEERIFITGHPHYDRYINGPTKAKEDFFKEFGLDLGKKLILFAPLGDKFVRHNDLDEYAMEILSELKNMQILVRFPPDEKVTLRNFLPPKNMVFHRPGQAFSGKFEDREIKREDDESLINSIYWSDVVITGPTSIILDAAFFDKPVIAAHLVPRLRQGFGGQARHYFDTVYCYDFSHIKKVLLTGGVKYADSREALLTAVRHYIRDPRQDAEGREKIRSLWFSDADGNSSRRLFDEVLKFAHNQ